MWWQFILFTDNKIYSVSSGRQEHRQAHRQTGTQADRQADTQAGRHTGRQAHRQAGRHTGRRADDLSFDPACRAPSCLAVVPSDD